MNKTIKIMVVSLFAFGCNNTIAQEGNTNTSNEVIVSNPVGFYVTQRMDSYPTVQANEIPEKEFPRGISESRQQLADHLATLRSSDIQNDPLVQTNPPTRISRSPIQNFPGLPLNVSPPDPSGAVGPNHYVQMTNGLWNVWDKQGVQASGFPRSLANPLGTGDGDPIVLYDREADRWLISQFDNPTDPTTSRFIVAVSTTGDPTGTYNVYSFNPDGQIDYPHFAVYGNSYIITGNFTPFGRMYALDREAMITGDPDAEMVALNMPNYVSGLAFNAPQPAHSEGAGIASGTAPIVWMRDNIFDGVTTDGISIWEFAVDWNDPSTATVSEPLIIDTAPFDSLIDGTFIAAANETDFFANLDQPGTTNRIDALVNVINYQTHRYDFGTHESMVLNFVVEVVNGSRQAGLRWMELRRTPGNDWELYQEGTFVDPNGDESVFMGAIGMDQEGNIAMGYIKTGNSTFPSLYYTGRAPGDPLGEMTLSEQLIIEGTSSVTTSSRYGDYGQLNRDPEDDLTFWYTSEYSGQPRLTQIASFNVSNLLSVDELIADDSDFTVTTNDNRNFELALRTESTNDILRLSIYNTLGQRVVYNQIERQGDTYRQTLDLTGESAGVYIVAIGNSKTQLNKKIIVK